MRWLRKRSVISAGLRAAADAAADAAATRAAAPASRPSNYFRAVQAASPACNEHSGSYYGNTSRGPFSQYSWFLLPMALALGLAPTAAHASDATADGGSAADRAAAGAAPAPPEATRDAVEDAMSVKRIQKRVFFKYEKRMRDHSTHEKIFDYFASTSSDEGQAMTASDVIRALLPIYPPDSAPWTRSGSLPGENKPVLKNNMSCRTREFLANFDLDGDGRFSFDEFLLFLVLLSVPLKDMHSIFAIMDANNSGELEQEEFLSVVSGLTSLAGKATPSRVARTGPQKVSKPEPHFIARWFGEDGSRRLNLKEFMAFLVELHACFDDLEFHILDDDEDGLISGLDLARSLVAPAETQIVDRLLNRAEKMPVELQNAQVDAQTFRAMQVMVNKYHRIRFAIQFWQDTGHDVDELAVRRTVNTMCKYDMPEVVVSIFFAVFKDEAGRWDTHGMHSALKGKYKKNMKYTKDEGRMSLLQCLIGCVNPVQP